MVVSEVEWVGVISSDTLTRGFGHSGFPFPQTSVEGVRETRVVRGLSTSITRVSVLPSLGRPYRVHGPVGDGVYGVLFPPSDGGHHPGHPNLTRLCHSWSQETETCVSSVRPVRLDLPAPSDEPAGTCLRPPTNPPGPDRDPTHFPRDYSKVLLLSPRLLDVPSSLLFCPQDPLASSVPPDPGPKPGCHFLLWYFDRLFRNRSVGLSNPCPV